MFKHIFSLAILTILLAGCISNRQSTASSLVNDPGNNSINSEDVKNPTDLTNYLQRIAGVMVTGSGQAARIRIRGPVSFSAGEEPLFVVDGTKRGFEYATIYNSINVREISSVRVLKNASETAKYGTQGAAGVIEISLKD